MPTLREKHAYLLLDSGEVIRFDAVTQETHGITSDITEHPVEKGANVTDHVRSQTDTMTLEVFVSNAPIRGDDHFELDTQVGAVAPLDLQPAAFTGIGGTVDPRLNGKAASVLQFDQPTNFVAEVYRALRELKEGAELLTIVTRLWDYEDMVIKEVSIPRTAAEGDGAKITINFKQVRLVETKIVAAPVPTEVRGKPAVDKGAKGGKDSKDGTDDQSKKKSILASALDGLKGLFK